MWSRVVRHAGEIGPLRLHIQLPPASRQTQNSAAELATSSQAQLEEINAAVEQRVQQAFESGVREGQAKCASENDAHVQAVMHKLMTTIAEVADSREHAIRQAEAETLRLSIAIARRILHRELSAGSSGLEPLIEAAFAKLRGQEIHRVRVHPELEQTARACLERAGCAAAIEVLSDPSQEPGGVIFEMARGGLDASLETQLREIERAFTHQLGGDA